MALYIIGIGLNDEKDITLKGLELVQSSDMVYLENYTSKLSCDIKSLELLYKKKIILAEREFVESGEELLKQAKTKNIALLIIGDPMSATTHIDLFLRAKEKRIPVKIINNASVLTAIGITGLQLYKFGKTASIPFPEPNFQVKTHFEILETNQKNKMHTLFLLDLRPAENRFMTVNQALDNLLDIQKTNNYKLLTNNTIVIGCTALGSNNPEIKAGPLSKIKKHKFKKFPQCLIIPSDLHFIEEEALELYK